MLKGTRSHIATSSRKMVGKSAGGPPVVPIGEIEQAILLIRGERAILDSDLAKLYGVATKALNQAVKRNLDRFPRDFMFRLTGDEAKCLRSQFATSERQSGDWGPRSQSVTLKRGSNIKYLPHAFTEHGTIMAATVLNSPRAVQVSVYVVRAFVQLRRMMGQNKELAGKLAQLERKVGEHDLKIVALIQAIRQLMAPEPEPRRKPIGFQSEQ